MTQEKDLEDSPPPAYQATLPTVHIFRCSEVSPSTDPISASAHDLPPILQPCSDDQAQINRLAPTLPAINTHGSWTSSGQSGALERTFPCSICLQSQATSPVHLTNRHSVCISHSDEFFPSFHRWCGDYLELAGGSITDPFGAGRSRLEYQLDHYFAFAQAQGESDKEIADHSSPESSPFLTSPTGSFIDCASSSPKTSQSLVAGADGGVQSSTADVAVQTSPTGSPLQVAHTVSNPEYVSQVNLPASPLATTSLSDETGPDFTAMSTPLPPAPQTGALVSLPTSFVAHPNSPGAASSSSGSSYRSYLSWSKSEMEEAIRLTEEKEAIYYGGQSQEAPESLGSGLAVRYDSDHDVQMRGSSDED